MLSGLSWLYHSYFSMFMWGVFAWLPGISAHQLHIFSACCWLNVGGHVEMAFMQAYSRFKTIINPSNQLPIAKSIIAEYLSRFAWQQSSLGLDLILLGFIKIACSHATFPWYMKIVLYFVKLNYYKFLDFTNYAVKNKNILILRPLKDCFFPPVIP